MPDNLDEDFIDEEPEDEQEIVGPERGGLSDESKEAIHGAFGNGPDKSANKKPAPGAREESAKPETRGQQPGATKSKPETEAQKAPPATSSPSPTPNSKPQTPSQPGSAGRAANLAQGARVGADIARNPREGAAEAGKAVAGRAGKKAAKEVAKRAAEAALSETVIVPVLIEAADKLAGIASQVSHYIPGASKFTNWVNNHKAAAIIILFLLVPLPFVGFAVGYAAGSDSGLTSTDTNVTPFTGNADQLLLYPNDLDATKMAQAIDQFIAQKQPNSPMDGLGAAFVESARAYGVNPFFTASQAAYENQFGTTPNPVPGYNSTGSFNPFGIIAEGTAGRTKPFFDGVRYVRYAKYNNYQEGILAHDKVVKDLLNQGNTTFDGMINKYVGSLNRERVNQQILDINQMMAAASTQ